MGMATKKNCIKRNEMTKEKQSSPFIRDVLGNKGMMKIFITISCNISLVTATCGCCCCCCRVVSIALFPIY